MWKRSLINTAIFFIIMLLGSYFLSRSLEQALIATAVASVIYFIINIVIAIKK